MNSQSILLIDDDANFRTSVQLALEDKGHRPQIADNAQKGIELFLAHLDSETPFDLILTDMRMPLHAGQPEDERGGLRVIEEIKAQLPDAILLVMTAYGTIHNAVQAVRMGATDYLQKPFEAEELHLRIEKALSTRQLQRENRSLRQENQRLFEQVAAPYHPSGIIGESDAIRTLHEQIQRAAQTDATVLISGESGTGKDLVAHAIHHQSSRARKPMIPLNCAAFPEHLIESELFGHVRGAFTGAHTDRIGAFEDASDGTIFLDEIGEMPLQMQPRLLRVLESKRIKRIGENRERAVDVRVVAATHRDLPAQIAAGHFREDLFERLNVIEIHIPPLRDHKEDIPLLAHHFIGLLDSTARIEGISDAALDALMAYDWHRNVRELRNVIERTVLFMTDTIIEPHHLALPDAPVTPSQSTPRQETGFSIVLPADCTTLAEMEAEAIKQAIAHTDGNITQAAKLIGVARETFRRKLSQMGR